MTITAEAPVDIDETDLATETTIAALTDLLKAAAPTPTETPAPAVADVNPVAPVGYAVTVQASGLATWANLEFPMDAETAMRLAVQKSAPRPARLDCYCSKCLRLGGRSAEKLAIVLETAADQIDRWGWASGSWLDPEGRMCALQAVRAALVGGDAARDWHLVALSEDNAVALHHVAELALSSWIVANDPMFAHYPSISALIWNDMPGRTKEQVTTALRGAASEVRAEIARAQSPVPCP